MKKEHKLAIWAYIKGLGGVALLKSALDNNLGPRAVEAALQTVWKETEEILGIMDEYPNLTNVVDIPYYDEANPLHYIWNLLDSIVKDFESRGFDQIVNYEKEIRKFLESYEEFASHLNGLVWNYAASGKAEE